MINHHETYSNKKILITGGNGFIGAHLTQTLHSLKASVDITVHTKATPKLFLPSKNIHSINLEQKQDVDRLVQHKYDIIFHCAGLTGQRQSEDDPYKSYMSNIAASMNLLESLRARAPHTRLILLSSYLEYGKPTSLPLNESHNVHPKDLYSIQKAAISAIAMRYAELFDMPVTVLRLFTIYGPDLFPRAADHNVIRHFLRLARNHEPLPIFAPGTQLRDFLHVQDLLHALLLTGSTKKTVKQIYNVGSGTSHSIAFVAKLIAREFQTTWHVVKPSHREQSYEHGDIRCDPSKFMRDTQWKPALSLREGIVLCKQGR